MELNAAFFIDHSLAFHFALSVAAIACSYALISFFKLASGLTRFAVDTRGMSDISDEASSQGVFLIRRHALDARLPGTAA